MTILLTGATGYIGKRLLPILIENGHKVICCVRDPNRFDVAESMRNYIEIIKVDFLEKPSLEKLPKDIDAAYYLIHSMSNSSDYDVLEETSANNFKDYLDSTAARHVIYLSGIVNQKILSKHLASRKNVEDILDSGQFNLTTLRAGIIMGSGSASFEIIRDLVEKLPLMIAPKWLNTYNKNYDIGGPDILTYKEMLLQFGQVRKLKRWIYTVPIMTPKLSSYWLYLVTSTSYNLARSLVDSMKIEVVCRDRKINEILNINPENYQKTIERAFEKIAANQIVSSWKDSQVSGVKNINISDFIDVPDYGCFKDVREQAFKSKRKVIDKIWAIGGENGWYHANALWKIRGYIDKIFGGVGLRRGRTNKNQLHVGDALDFWRVLYADKNEGRLLLFAEMKLPGEAWLEFKIRDNVLVQSATFRPHGLLGRLYWYSVLPLHGIIFKGMLNKIANP